MTKDQVHDIKDEVIKKVEETSWTTEQKEKSTTAIEAFAALIIRQIATEESLRMLSLIGKTKH